MIPLFICISCSQIVDIRQDDPFRNLYGRSLVPVRASLGKTADSPKLSLSCHNMPLSLFCRILSDKFLVGMVYAESLSNKLITAEFKDTDLQSVLNVVSRQLSVDIVRVGNTFFVGSLRPEDRGILVRRVLGYESVELNTMVKAMLSTNGKASVLSNSVVVVADHESVIRRITELLDYLDSVESDTWILQLCFVLLRKDALLEAGLDVKSSGTISYNISENRLDLSDFSIEGLFNLASSSSFADLYASPMLLIRDGKTGNWKDGKKVPIPKKTVSDSGTVTTTGYEYVETGFIVSATVKQSRRGARVMLNIEKSDISSYVEEAPLTVQSVYTTEIEMEPLKPYLLGELSQFKVLDTQRNVLNFGRDKGKTAMQVWGQLYRIRGESYEKFQPAMLKTTIFSQEKSGQGGKVPDKSPAPDSKSQ